MTEKPINVKSAINTLGHKISVCAWENERTNSKDGSKFKVLSFDINRSVFDKITNKYMAYKNFSYLDLAIISELCLAMYKELSTANTSASFNSVAAQKKINTD
jgi:hypothetical protein